MSFHFTRLVNQVHASRVKWTGTGRRGEDTFVLRQNIVLYVRDFVWNNFYNMW